MTSEEGESLEPLPNTEEKDEEVNLKDTDTAKLLYPSQTTSSTDSATVPEDTEVEVTDVNTTAPEVSDSIAADPLAADINSPDPLLEDLSTSSPANIQEVTDEFTNQPSTTATAEDSIQQPTTTSSKPVVTVTTDNSTSTIQDILPLKTKSKKKKKRFRFPVSF